MSSTIHSPTNRKAKRDRCKARRRAARRAHRLRGRSVRFTWADEASDWLHACPA